MSLVFKISAVCLLATLAGMARAQVAVEEQKTLMVSPEVYHDVAVQLRCPTCTGLSVLDSDAAFSVQIKNQVKEQLNAGKSKTEILDFFVVRYGPWILRSPPMRGVNALAWIVPIACIVVGPFLIWFFIGRKQVKLVGRGRETVRSTETIVVEMKERLAALQAPGRNL